MDWSDKGPLLDKMAQAVRDAAAHLPLHMRSSNQHIEAAKVLAMLHAANDHYEAEAVAAGEAAAAPAEHPLTVPPVAEEAKPVVWTEEPVREAEDRVDRLLPEVNYDPNVND